MKIEQNMLLKIKNIDELKQLVEQLRTIVDKIENLNLEIVINQCEHSQDKSY